MRWKRRLLLAASSAQARAMVRKHSTARQEFLNRVQTGELRANPAQLAVLACLDGVASKLSRREKATSASSSLASWFGISSVQPRALQRLLTPSSVYIHGAVGVGKTFAADLWLQNFKRSIPREGTSVNSSQVQRWHFHSFMLNVHKQLHELRKTGSIPAGDQLRHLSQQIAAQVSLVSAMMHDISYAFERLLVWRYFADPH